jgi:hypothetical protein
MKVIGLMITCNEEWIIEQSITILLKYVDEVLVLDASTDRTREALITSDRVTVYFQENYPELTNYGEYRQFLLEKGRHHGGTHFVCIDADEMFPRNFTVELFNDYIINLPIGYAYQFNVANFYKDPYHYTMDGKIGSKFIDVIFYDDKEFTYRYRNEVHEERTPCNKYIKLEFPLLHYGCLSTLKMDLRRLYYMLLECKYNINSVRCINFNYYINSCMSRNFRCKLNLISNELIYPFINYSELNQDCGISYINKIYTIYMENPDKFNMLNLHGTFSFYKVTRDRIIDLIRTRSIRVIFKSLRDYLILDILKKW